MLLSLGKLILLCIFPMQSNALASEMAQSKTCETGIVDYVECLTVVRMSTKLVQSASS